MSRFARLSKNGTLVYVELEGDTAHELSHAPWEGGTRIGKEHGWTEDDLRAPVRPGKVLCVGRNYAAHAKELGNEVPKTPLLFLKPSSSVIGSGEAIVLPVESTRVEHEAELAVVIGKTAKNIRAEDAFAHVFGYTCGGDITARDLQRSDGQWSRAKGFDTFCPLGPWIETKLDPSAISIRCAVNDQARQDGNTRDMVFQLPELIATMSRAMTLEPGDVLLTGTPEGVGPLVAGDVLTITIEGIGTLKCRVEPSQSSA